MEGRRRRDLPYPALQPVPAAPSLNRAWPWALAALAAVTIVIAAMIPDALVGVFYDDGIYAVLGRSLAEGTGYRLQHLPGAPPAVHYPFGYPAFLAALWSLWPSFPANVALLRGANAVLMGLFAALAVAWLAPRLPMPRWATLALVVAACTAIPMIAVATVLFSEPLFLALLVPALWCADAAARPERRRAIVLAACAGAFAGAAALTRSIGIAAVLAVPMSLLFARRVPLAALAGTVSILLLIPWLLWSSRHAAATDHAIVANYGTYGQFLGQAGTSLLSPSSLFALARPLGAISLPVSWPAARLVLGAVSLAVLAWGFVALWPIARVVVLFVGGYLAVVATWPYGPDRFLWALLPWLAIAFGTGVHSLWFRHKGGPWMRAVAALAVLTIAVGFGRLQISGFARGGATAAQRDISASFDTVLPWIRETTDSSAVIAVEDEALVWLYTGRRAVPSYLWRVRGRSSESLGADTLRSYLERTGATHLILSGPGSDAAQTVNDLIGRHPGYLRVIRAWPGPKLAFQIQRGG